MAFSQLNKDLKLDAVLGQLDNSQRAAVMDESPNVVIRAPAGSGKALKNGTKVLTSTGWKNIELLTLEDKIAAEDGRFYNLLGIYPQGKKEIYKVIFSDDNIIECCENHLWLYQTKNQRDSHRNNFKYSKLKSTKELLDNEKLKNNNGSWNIYIPMVQPIQFEEKEVPLDPYLLGVLLGDGNLSGGGLVFTVAEEDLKHKVEDILKNYNCNLKYISQYDYAIQGNNGFGYNNVQNYVGAAIRELGLKGTNSFTKFIPDIYKYNSPDIRLKVLQGIIDTDGYAHQSGYDITLVSKQLLLDVQWLCESLGFTATYQEKDNICNGQITSRGYRLYIKTSEQFPKIHTTKSKERTWKQGQSTARRTIREIIPTGSFAEMTCIEIDSPKHLFITEHCIVTHNTKSLLSAVINYRYEHLNDRICAITFTRAARAEMEMRLREIGIYDIEVTTIHVWARNQLEYFADLYDFKIQIMEEPQIKQILSELVKQYVLRSRIKSVNINILYSYITGSKNMDITDNYRRTLNALEERYIMYKRDNGLYDFTDYPLYLYDVLETYQETITTIDALFVDEFQDVDEIQFMVFEKVKAQKKFYIGDSWQSIYQFRNADGKVFHKLKDFEAYKLKFNYRSYQEIIDYATTVYEELAGDYSEDSSDFDLPDSYITSVRFSLPSSIQCSRGYGGWVVSVDPYGDAICWENNQEKQVDYIEAFRTIIQTNPMILCRTNKQVKAVQELGWNDVSTVHQAKGLEYTNVIVIDTTIKCGEDLNIAYVAMTRAKDRLYIINWPQAEYLLREWKRFSEV